MHYYVKKVSSTEYCVFGAASVSVWRFLGHYLNRDTHNALRELHRMNLMRVPVEYGQLPGWGVPFKEVHLHPPARRGFLPSLSSFVARRCKMLSGNCAA